MAITKTFARAPCPIFAGRGVEDGGFTIKMPYKTYLTCEKSNIASERSLLTVFNYDLAEYVYNQTADAYAFGVYVETGAFTDAITDGKHMYAAKFFLKLSEAYSLGSGERHNCDIRAVSIGVESAYDLSGVLHGAYISAQFKEDADGVTIGGFYLSHTATYGVIGLEVRTEAKDNGDGGITVGAAAYGVVGILVAQKNDAAFTGNYAAIVLHVPYEGSDAIVGSTYGIRFDTGGLWAGTDFDVGIDFGSQVIKGINFDGCTMALDADVTLTAATNAVNLNVTSTAAQSTGYNQVLQVTMTHSGDLTGGECHLVALDAIISGNCPILFLQTFYIETSGNPTLGMVAGISMYFANLGTNADNVLGIDLQMNHTADDPTSRYGYFRLRAHNLTYMPRAVMYCEGSNGAENLISFDTAAPSTGMLSTASDSTDVTYEIAVEILGVGTKYIHLFDT